MLIRSVNGVVEAPEQFFVGEIIMYTTFMEF